MRKRGQDSEAVMARRLAAAREEMSHYDEFDYVIVNEHFDTAVDEMCTIFAATRLRRRVQAPRHAELLEPMLAGESAHDAQVGGATSAEFWGGLRQERKGGVRGKGLAGSYEIGGDSDIKKK